MRSLINFESCHGECGKVAVYCCRPISTEGRDRNSGSHEEFPEVSDQEFDVIWKEIKLRKMLGIDGIPNMAIQNNFDVFRNVF